MSWDVHEGPTKILRGCIIDGDTLGIITSVKYENNFAAEFKLLQNFPNPFNPKTRISYNLPKGSDVKFYVHNLLGEIVLESDYGYKESGSYEIIFDGSTLTSGIYVYSIKAGENYASKKMILIK